MLEPKCMFAFAFLLIAVPLHAQDPARPSGVTETAAAQAGSQMQNPKIASSSFNGVVIQVEPLEVKSASGDVQTFLPADRQDLTYLTKPKPGDLVSLTYEPTPKGNILREEIKIIGATIIGTIKEIATDMSWVIVRTRNLDKPENEVNVPLQTSIQFQPLVSAMRPGDGIMATYVRSGGINTTDGINSVKSLEWQSKSVGRAARWWSLIGAMAALYILAYIFTQGRPTALFLGTDNRYSSSKFQTVLWFSLVIGAYVAIVYHRIFAAGWSYVGGVDIPPNLLILSGISVLSFTAAKAITVGKVEKAATEGRTDMKASADTPRMLDLVTDDSNRTDLGDFQMVAITILAVIIYAISAVEFMDHIEFRRVVTMPDVDATLLSIFGLGQAAYLGKKAAGNE
ncbi:hypothetical protein [Nitrosospira sp. Nsp13]|uniref:hypothetical protein n=1 Tax=Nitrosospira sp. Nsp13 TaxID=1855332 RepID=UPI000881865A|nr:hypothetical protein [Nitrosospira sp. Nsp13]SCX86067.1 hypothetical protein SAMN05216308_101602 [Nitrosospira sp. Nsp13]